MKILRHSLGAFALLGVILVACVSCRRGDSARDTAPELILYCGAGIRPLA